MLASGPFDTTITQAVSLALEAVGTVFSAPLQFAEFDPALGQLTGVSVILQATFNGTVAVENLSTVPDMAAGIIARFVTVATNDNSFAVQVPRLLQVRFIT